MRALLDGLGIEYRAAGHFYVARCPNPEHEDRNPSWRIDAEDGTHRCFSCGFSGGVRALVEVLGNEYKPGELPAAPVPLDVEISERRARPTFVLPYGVVVSPVRSWPKPARDYLAARGIPDAQAEAWGLGYAVDGRLAGRVVIPVRNAAGVLVSYTARAYGRAQRKYLEPGTDEGADKAAIFGEERWPAEPGDALLVVVEGGFDGLAVERTVGGYFAALYGSQWLPGHAAKLSRWKRILLVTDSDAAGDKVADEIRGSLGRWAALGRARLPEGDDCASLAQKAPHALREAILGACLGATPRSAISNAPTP